MRLQPEDRRKIILASATQVARDHGLAKVTHGAVAKQCVIQTSIRTVKRHYGNQGELWLAVYNSNRLEFNDEAIALGLANA